MDHLLAPILRELHQLHPDIVIDLDTSQDVRISAQARPISPAKHEGAKPGGGSSAAAPYRRLDPVLQPRLCLEQRRADKPHELKKHGFIGGGGGNLWRALPAWLQALGLEERVACIMPRAMGLIRRAVGIRDRSASMRHGRCEPDLIECVTPNAGQPRSMWLSPMRGYATPLAYGRHRLPVRTHHPAYPPTRGNPRGRRIVLRRNAVRVAPEFFIMDHRGLRTEGDRLPSLNAQSPRSPIFGAHIPVDVKAPLVDRSVRPRAMDQVRAPQGEIAGQVTRRSRRTPKSHGVQHGVLHRHPQRMGRTVYPEVAARVTAGNEAQTSESRPAGRAPGRLHIGCRRGCGTPKLAGETCCPDARRSLPSEPGAFQCSWLMICFRVLPISGSSSSAIRRSRRTR